jgi:hypothetical protein
MTELPAVAGECHWAPKASDIDVARTVRVTDRRVSRSAPQEAQPLSSVLPFTILTESHLAEI